MPESNDATEQDIRAALRPHRVDPDEFLAAVEAKVKEREAAPAEEGLERAASILPITLLGVAGKATGALKASPTIWQKLLVLISWPAASIFVLLGLAVFSARGLRRTSRDAEEQRANPSADELKLWWSNHRGWTTLFWVGTMLTMLFGSSFFVLCILNLSAVGLLFMVRSITRAGHASRIVISTYCTMGLFYLGMPLMFVSGPLTREPHVVDPRWLPVVFLLGAALMPIGRHGRLPSLTGRRVRPTYLKLLLLSYSLFLAITAVNNSTFRRGSIVNRVESFDHAPYSSANWREWALLSSWAGQQGVELDLARPRELLSRELEKEANPFILASAIRGGLLRDVVESASIDWAVEDAKWEQHLERLAKGSPLLSAEQWHWQLRLALERGLLSESDRDLLIRKTLERVQADPVLGELVQLIEALDLLDEQADEELRPWVHKHVLAYWAPENDGILIDGGFGPYRNPVGSDPNSTYEAIQLMLRFGAPDGVDLEQLEWYLRSKSSSLLPFFVTADHRVARVARASFEPLAPPVTLGRFLRLERSLIGAVILVLLCFYATLSAQKAPPSEYEE